MVAARPAEAYLFHEDCWILLCQQFAGGIDLNKLFEVCKDVPPYGRNIFLGKPPSFFPLSTRRPWIEFY